MWPRPCAGLWGPTSTTRKELEAYRENTLAHAPFENGTVRTGRPSTAGGPVFKTKAGAKLVLLETVDDPDADTTCLGRRLESVTTSPCVG